MFTLLTVFAAVTINLWSGPWTASEANTGDISLVTFGTGKTKVWLYSDYFCGACSKLEPNLDAIMVDLAKKNSITLTFVDSPIHRYSPLYARYFLYILNEKKDLHHALSTRALLFEAAKAKIADEEKLRAFLTSKGIAFKAFDVKPVFSALQARLMEDKIKATPTCVIIREDQRESFEGVEDITKALKKLK